MCSRALVSVIALLSLPSLAADFDTLSRVSGGTFQMGDAFGETGSNSDELPVHDVNVSTFYIGRFEVTAEVWNEVYAWAITHGYSNMASGLSYGPNHPVRGKDWYSVVKWCNARSEKEGLTPCYKVSGAIYRTSITTPDCDFNANGYRLPTEAEWEKAARGGLVGARFPWGDTISHAEANYFASGVSYGNVGGNVGPHPAYGSATAPVGSFPANGYGLFDAAGNVGEWCWDRYSSTYYAVSPDTDPRGPDTGTYRVYRTGGWGSANEVRVANRMLNVLSYDSLDLGFRVARSAVGAPVPVIPSISILPATDLGPTRATLNAVVNPNTLTTTAYFEYGTTTAYGSTALVTLTPPDGSSDQTVSKTVTGLEPDTLYHFRIKALNAAGWLVSPDMTFTTGLTPVVFIPGIAGSVLNWDPGAPGLDTQQLWPSTVAPWKIALLDLNSHPNEDIKAVGVVRSVSLNYESVYVFEEFYGPFLDYMASAAGGSHHEFNLEDDPGRLTSSYMLDYAQEHPGEAKPTLFPFPYDWRRSNAAHTATLHQYIERIRQLHGTDKVNVVCHSMGGLLFRRYLLDHGESCIGRVVTVGSPFWGAPQGIYRMFAGTFYNDDFLDTINGSALFGALNSLPGVFELLPSDHYCEESLPLMSEAGGDFDGNGVVNEMFSTAQTRWVIDRNARPTVPSVANAAFHNFQGGRQDDWSADTGTVPFLHIVGRQDINATTIHVQALPYTTWWGDDATRFIAVPGEGDGVVPLLSSERLAAYRSPNSEVWPVPGANAEVEHTALMRHGPVLDKITEFLNGTVAASAVSSKGASPLYEATNWSGARILISGCSYASVTNSVGDQNTKAGEDQAKKIPGTAIEYGGAAKWMELKVSDGEAVTIDGPAEAGPFEILMERLSATGAVTAMARYRFVSTGGAWRVIQSDITFSVSLDVNLNGSFEPAEILTPTHQALSGAVDVTRPTISLNLTANAGALQVVLGAADNVTSAPTIRYTLDGGAPQSYTGALTFAAGQNVVLKAFSEDESGNLSGMITTSTRPALSIAAGTFGEVMIEWSQADAYVLDESSELPGGWTKVTAPTTHNGGKTSVALPTGVHSRKFYRLRSAPVTR